MTATLQTTGTLFAVATRVSPLDANGVPDAGESTFVTDILSKATITPVLETGVDLTMLNAAGDLSTWYKHPDMVKYGTVSIELTKPDPYLVQACCGGVVYTDTTAALGAPTGLTLTTQTTLGLLPAATYGYRATQYSVYGESTAETEVDATTTGSTGAILINGFTFGSGAVGINVYGRVPGEPRLIGSILNIGSQTTSAASGTGAVTSLSVTALTQAIPAGATFTITGDTNTRKIVFTVTATAGVGAVALLVTASESITTTIAAAAIVPCLLDTGAAPLTGVGPPSSDGSAGPGNNVGYQSPALGPVGNPTGVSLEFWTLRSKNGWQASDYPYLHWVYPRVTGMHIQPRDHGPDILTTVMEGQAHENPLWVSPANDWPRDGTKWYQYAPCGLAVLPAPSVSPVAALA